MKAKYIGMILLSSFIGIILNPEILTASDSIVVADLDQSAMTETVILAPETSAIPVVNNVAVRTVVTKTAAAKAAEVKVAAVKTTDQIKFAWGAQTLKNASSTEVDAGADAMKSERLIWAHNNTAFNNIKNLKIGDTFAVTLNGVTKKYKVAANPIDGAKGITAKVINVNRGELYHEQIGNFYTSALEKGWKHDLVLMTCAGTNGSHRYIVVADEI